jgi:hypothetical protein
VRNLTIIALFGLFIFACSVEKADKNDDDKYLRPLTADTVDATNDFYDNAETYSLPIQALSIEGEIENPGIVDFSKLPLRSVIVKETLLSDDGDKFVGAYRYDGYALYDILNQIKLNKKNKEEFSPIIDLYVQIENDKGEKINISWGEIYYPNQFQEIIIASKVMRIVPSKTNDLWPLPEVSKLVVSRDLITERNISNPVKITVKSYPKSFETIKGLKPLYSPKIDIYKENQIVETLTENPKDLQIEKFNTIFYGRGRGIHSTQPFTGVMLKEVLAKHVSFTKKNIREGLFLVVAKDGYRGIFTFSEIMNRNDQSEILLICRPETTNNGIFRLFPACDFFSDRAIKGINEIYFSTNEQ